MSTSVDRHICERPTGACRLNCIQRDRRPRTMDTEAADGYCPSNGDCPPRNENSRMLVDLSVNTPNGQESQGPHSPSERPIKQEEGGGEEVDRRSSPPEEEAGHSGEEGSLLEEPMTDSPNNRSDGASDAGNRLQNGDRPFQCNQCGVSFTQKGNLLRHIKLHTGEKPFKCPFCSYACRRRDALSGHLRTHSVGKPHKCNYCGRSYKQRASLEEHKERCHSYLQSAGMDPSSNARPYQGEVPKEQKAMAEAATMATFDRPPVIERLQSSVGKRKSSNPQKFVGEKMVRYGYPELSYEMGLKFEKEAELMQAHMMDQAINNAISYLGSESLRPLGHHPHSGPPLSMAEVVPMVNPLFHHVYSAMGPRMDRPGGHEAPPPPLALPPPPPEFPPSSNGPMSLTRPKHPPPRAARGESPSNSGLDSADSSGSSPQERLGYPGNMPRPRTVQASPGYSSREEGRAPEAAAEAARAGAERHVSLEAVRVFGREGQEVRVFQCDHCRILFVDHVMYTIHMGCHGYRDPMECNICGHRSKDNYEFYSHIVRGEHTFH